MSEHDKEMELPYELLAEFGLSRQMVDDLPDHVIRALKHERRTPVMPITVKGESDTPIRCKARMALCGGGDGTPRLVFYPQTEVTDLSRFSEEQQAELKQGKAVMASLTNADGQEVRAFCQVDRCTGQVLSVPTPVIGHNLQMVADAFHLNPAEMACLQHGEPLTLVEDDEPVTVGIDLENADSGIRMAKGDERQWREQPRKEYAKYNFGVFGCWVMDDLGNMEYLPEEEYTEELWDEMKRHGVQRTHMNPKL